MDIGIFFQIFIYYKEDCYEQSHVNSFGRRMFHFSCINAQEGNCFHFLRSCQTVVQSDWIFWNYWSCMYRRVPAVQNPHQHLCVVFLSISCHNFIFDYCSVTKSCPALVSHVDCGSPVLHHLLECAQICLHWVGSAMIKNSKYTQKRTSNPYVIITHQLCHNFSSFLSTPTFFFWQWRCLLENFKANFRCHVISPLNT